MLLEREGGWRGPTARRSRSSPGGGLLGADVAFPVLHGPFGEDGTVQGLLELLDVPYVGAGVLASSLCMDKVVFKDVLAAAGVPQVDYAAVREARWRADPDAVRAELAPLGLPAVRQAGAARLLGRDREGARRGRARRRARRRVRPRRARDRRGVQPGIEVECAVMGLYEAEASVPGEVVLIGGAEWYDYEAKYARRAAMRAAGARRGSPRRRRPTCAGWPCETFLRVGCAGLARVDFFVEDGGRVLVNELNTLPGMTPTSAFPKLWEAAGVPWPEACDRLLGSRWSATAPSARGHAF